MARTEQKVRSLIEEEPALAEAIGAIMEAADGGEGSVEWADVRDELTSGQWGRLIELGILVDAGTGFAFAEPAVIKEVLDDEDINYIVATADEADSEESQWTKWDKGAAALTAVLFSSYIWEPGRNVAGQAMDLVLGPATSILPLYALIMILAMLTGLYSTILQDKLVNREKMGEYKERMEAIQEKRQRAKEQDDDEALEEIQREQMDAIADQLGMFKEQFRPMVWIMFLTIPVFLWLLWAVSFRLGDPAYNPETEFGSVYLPFTSNALYWSDQIIFYFETWLIWYFVCSLAFTQLLRKALDVKMSPG